MHHAKPRANISMAIALAMLLHAHVSCKPLATPGNVTGSLPSSAQQNDESSEALSTNGEPATVQSFKISLDRQPVQLAAKQQDFALANIIEIALASKLAPQTMTASALRSGEYMLLLKAEQALRFKLTLTGSGKLCQGKQLNLATADFVLDCKPASALALAAAHTGSIISSQPRQLDARDLAAFEGSCIALNGSYDHYSTVCTCWDSENGIDMIEIPARYGARGLQACAE